jgi:hypothetical protein
MFNQIELLILNIILQTLMLKVYLIMENLKKINYLEYGDLFNFLSAKLK